MAALLLAHQVDHLRQAVGDVVDGPDDALARGQIRGHAHRRMVGEDLVDHRIGVERIPGRAGAAHPEAVVAQVGAAVAVEVAQEADPCLQNGNPPAPDADLPRVESQGERTVGAPLVREGQEGIIAVDEGAHAAVPDGPVENRSSCRLDRHLLHPHHGVGGPHLVHRRPIRRAEVHPPRLETRRRAHEQRQIDPVEAVQARSRVVDDLDAHAQPGVVDLVAPADR